jgi:adenylylsulfate kinase
MDDSRDLEPDHQLTMWLTGLPGAGKSTVAQALFQRLRARGQPCAVLDGDVMRRGLSADLGFSPADRRENIRRVAEVARLFNQAGVGVIVALITPLASDRALARDIVGPARFVEVFIDAPLALCESRDPKGLYRRARGGSLPNFTGVAAPYEAPTLPDVHLRTGELSLSECIMRLEAVWCARDDRDSPQAM